jgi:hypothetical protein
MKVLTEILTILNFCSVQFYGLFDSNTSLHQSIVPAVIVSKEVRNISQEILQSIQPASLSQKCLNSEGTAIILFTSVNDPSTINPSAYPLQNDPTTLNRYNHVLQRIAVFSNPAFVLLQIEPTLQNHELIFDWLILPITSQLLLFDTETIYRPTIDLGPSLRITFNNQGTLQPGSSPLNAISRLKKKAQTKLNLNGRYFYLTAGFPGREEISDCSLNLDQLHTYPELCSLHLLEKQLNFTTTLNHQPGYAVLQLLNALADPYVNNIIITKSIPGFQWLIHGVKFNPYKLTLITKLQSVNVDSLLQPFDINIWMALLTANFLFFGVVCVGLKFKKKPKLIFWMVSTTLSQMDENLTNYLFDKKRWINFPLVASWFFFIFVLSMLYQGDLYSCLTNVRVPVLPNSLKETLITNIPLFTVGQSCRYPKLGPKILVCQSALLDFLIPDIFEANKETNDLIKTVASRVLNRTEHIPGNTTVLQAALISVNSDKLRVSNKSWVTLNTFGILSSSMYTDEFIASAKFFFKDYSVRQTSDVNPFITFKPWIAQRGPFASAFSSGIGSLTESGLIARWRKHYQYAVVTSGIKAEFESLRDLENKILDKKLSQQLQLSRAENNSYKWEGSGRVYARLMLVPDKNLKFPSVQSVPLLVMKLPFLACLVSISISIGLFLAELVHKKLKSKMEVRSPVNEMLTIYVKKKLQLHCQQVTSYRGILNWTVQFRQTVTFESRKYPLFRTPKIDFENIDALRDMCGQTNRPTNGLIFPYCGFTP